MGSRSLRVAGWIGTVLFGALYAAFLYNWRDPHLRLTVPSLNYLAFCLAQAIPFLVVTVLLLLCRRWWSRLMVGTLCLPVLALALLIGTVASSCAVEYRHGTDLSFERLRTVPTRFGSLVVYRTNAGAMTSYGIVVRQECPLISGVARVRDIGGGYPAYDVDLDLLDVECMPRFRSIAPIVCRRRPGRVQ